MSQLPQWSAFDATHCPSHASKPPVQTHCPPLHVCPIAHARPHPPQFRESVATFAHPPAQLIWPAPQVTPVPPVPPVPAGAPPTLPVHASAASASPAATAAMQTFDFITSLRWGDRTHAPRGFERGAFAISLLARRWSCEGILKVG